MSRLSSKPWFQKFRKVVLYFATHYTGAFLFVMAVTLVSTAFSISYLSGLEANLNSVYENDVKGGDAVQAADAALLTLESTAKDLVLYPDRHSQEHTRATLRGQSDALKAAMARAVPRFHTPKARQAMVTAQGDLKDFLGALEALASPDRTRLQTADLDRLRAVSTVLEKDFDLLLANRSANSTIGIGELVFQLRFSLVVTIAIVVVTLGVRFGLYLAGHPARLKRRKDD